MISAPLRIALLSYRSKPHSGGQGIYVRHLPRELAALGHHVEVFSGPPLPELDEGVGLTVLPSLDLYREPDPFRTPRREEFTSAVDVLEWAAMCTGAFPEPLTFSLRAWLHLKNRLGDFDVIHDNQCLGYGLLPLGRLGTPLVATIHHPITVDRDLELAAAPDWKRRASLRRWYAFTRMQGRVARRLPWLTTVSAASRNEIVEAFGVSPNQLNVIAVGVDTDTFRPTARSAKASTDPAEAPDGRPATTAEEATTAEKADTAEKAEAAEKTGKAGRDRIVSVASADVPLKGLPELIEAVAKLRAERDVELVVVGSARPDGPAAQSITRLGLGDAVRFVSGISDAELADLFRSATVAAVPSRYEGFSLPAVEAMSCGVPLVVTTAGALPEVAGPDGLASLHVPPGDAGALAAAIGRLLDDPELRRRLGAEGRARVVEHFTWRRTAIRTAEWYAQAIAEHRGSTREVDRQC
ncbi:MAG TPA: glycosyltransferase family 4 protein [Actinoplanes sp.]|nr:glycosyltransferase family 4 protein [Actinoplanes sp.]